jgi:hypothetical protein
MPIRMPFQSACIDLNQGACARSASVWSRPPQDDKDEPVAKENRRQP